MIDPAMPLHPRSRESPRLRGQWFRGPYGAPVLQTPASVQLTVVDYTGLLALGLVLW